MIDLKPVVDALGGIASALGASSFLFYANGSDLRLDVMTDGDVYRLAANLGLEVTVVSLDVSPVDGASRWWLRAISHDALRVEVAGPHHDGAPPADVDATKLARALDVAISEVAG